jgi:hypothetical protein
MTESRRMRWAGHVAYMARRGMRIALWWEKKVAKRPLERQRRRREDNIVTIFGEVTIEGV